MTVDLDDGVIDIEQRRHAVAGSIGRTDGDGVAQQSGEPASAIGNLDAIASSWRT